MAQEKDINATSALSKKPTAQADDFILQVRHLKMYFPTQTGFFKTRDLKAVDDVSFEVKRGETIGVVGESGCGKTTLGRTILHLYDPSDGEIIFNGREIRSKKNYKATLAKLKADYLSAVKKLNEGHPNPSESEKKEIAEQSATLKAAYDKALANEKEKRKNYRKDIEYLHLHAQMVFQDPYSSLDPRMTVEDIIAEPLDAHRDLYKGECEAKGISFKDFRHQRVIELMQTIGLSSEQATRYPHEFSGGQRQRIGIARSLALNPELVVCDEPVSALDVSIQAQVLNTFEELQQKLKLTYIFVAHNLLVVKHISDRIAVMYLGHVVELAESQKLFEEPMHPYTVSLLSAIPVPDPKSARKNERVVLKGDIPSPLNAPSGCPFRTRCPFAKDACASEKGKPVLREVRKGHFVACLFPLQAGRTGM
jgi:oligopeptide transport system ATP-binding protein